MRSQHLSILKLCLMLFIAIQSSREVAAEVPAKLKKWLGPQAWSRDKDTPAISLGEKGAFDDTHVMAPMVAKKDGQYWMWYCGSSGYAYDLSPNRTPDKRVYRLGLAKSDDGIDFKKHPTPIVEMEDPKRSIITPTILKSADGTLLKVDGKYRMWFCTATMAGGGRPHSIQSMTSEDGIHWSELTEDLLTRAYCPTVMKDGDTYRMWYTEPSKYPWLMHHATSKDGLQWEAEKKPVFEKTQDWEHLLFNYPVVLKVDGVYLMWYTSYATEDKLTTAIGFAASEDGLTWYKHPNNPVVKPNPEHAWEENYVSSGSVLQMPDGSFRMWYFSRKKPPFLNLYYAFGSATWSGPED